MRILNRPALPADHGFIAATWSASLTRPPAATFLSPFAWQRGVWLSVPAVLARPDVRALVAADGDEADQLFGWLAWIVQPGPPLVLFCYVKQPYRYDLTRRTGPRIATGLFKSAGIDPRAPFSYVCETAWATRLHAAGKINARWHPLLECPTPNDRNAHGQRSPEDHAAE